MFPVSIRVRVAMGPARGWNPRAILAKPLWARVARLKTFARIAPTFTSAAGPARITRLGQDSSQAARPRGMARRASGGVRRFDLRPRGDGTRAAMGPVRRWDPRGDEPRAAMGPARGWNPRAILAKPLWARVARLKTFARIGGSGADHAPRTGFVPSRMSSWNGTPRVWWGSPFRFASVRRWDPRGDEPRAAMGPAWG